jgi:hypothetical protein
MKRHGKQIDLRPVVPSFRVIAVHIAGNRFLVRRGRVKRVRQYAPGPVEVVSISVLPHGEKNGNGARRGRARPGLKIQRCILGPFVERAQDFRLHGGRQQL